MRLQTALKINIITGRTKETISPGIKENTIKG
jgi:hypothetical protein